MGSIGNYNAGYRARELELATEVVESIDEAISDIKDLIKKWRKEAAVIRRQKKTNSWTGSWKAKDIEKIHALEKCAEQLEALINDG